MATDLPNEPLKKVGITRQQVLTLLSPQGFSKGQQRQKILVQNCLDAAKMRQGPAVKMFNHSETPGGPIQ